MAVPRDDLALGSSRPVRRHARDPGGGSARSLEPGVATKPSGRRARNARGVTEEVAGQGTRVDPTGGWLAAHPLHAATRVLLPMAGPGRAGFLGGVVAEAPSPIAYGQRGARGKLAGRCSRLGGGLAPVVCGDVGGDTALTAGRARGVRLPMTGGFMLSLSPSVPVVPLLVLAEGAGRWGSRGAAVGLVLRGLVVRGPN